MPEAIPVQRRRDDTAADMRSLVDLGRADPQPRPAPPPAAPPVEEPVPQKPPPGPDPTDEQEAVALHAALADAGVAATPEDQAAVQALTRLDPATVGAVARWLREKKTPGPIKGETRG
jgi:hypothetical protein